jgi:hypothetical protein
MSIVGQVTDNNLRDAVTSLEASTRLLNAQTDTIHAQQAILSQQSRLRQQRQVQTSSHAQELQRRTAAEAQHISLINESKLNDLKTRLQGRLEKVEKQLRLLPAIIKEKLNSDDRLLASLESKGNEVQASTQSFDPVTERERVELLLKALQTAKVDEVKDRLDRTYLETLHANSHALTASSASSSAYDHHLDQDEVRGAETGVNGQPASDPAIKADLKAEIQSLYEEIDDVAAMLVDHSHGAPLREHLDEIEHTQQQNESQGLSETLERIKTMTTTLETMKTGVDEKISEREVLRSMLAHLDRIEREMNTQAAAIKVAPRATPGMGQDRKAQKALTEMLETLSLNDKGPSSKCLEHASDHEAETRKGDRFLIDTMQEAAQRRRQAVTILRDASISTTENEDKIQELEGRIAEARAHIEQNI